MLGDKIGTLEAGKFADLVVVNGDSLSDISMLREEARIGMVVKGGEIVVNRLRAAREDMSIMVWLCCFGS